MTIAFDASTPAITSGASSTQTSPSFSPPGGSLLVACMGFEALGTPSLTLTVSNTVSPLTWTLRGRRDSNDSGGEDGIAAIYTAICASALTAITVSAQSSKSSDAGGLKVFVVTGADLSDPVGAVGEGSTDSSSITPTVYNSTVAGSRAIGFANDFNASGLATSTDTEFSYLVASRDGGMAVHKAADTPSPSAAVTLNFTFPSNTRMNWVAIEVKPGAPFVAPRPLLLGQAVNRAANY